MDELDDPDEDDDDERVLLVVDELKLATSGDAGACDCCLSIELKVGDDDVEMFIESLPLDEDEDDDDDDDDDEEDEYGQSMPLVVLLLY